MEHLPNPEASPVADDTQPLPPDPTPPALPVRNQYALTETPFTPGQPWSYLRPPPHNVGYFAEANEWSLVQHHLTETSTPTGGKQRVCVALWVREVTFDPQVHGAEPDEVQTKVTYPPLPIQSFHPQGVPMLGSVRVVPGGAAPSRQYLPQDGGGARPTGNPRDTAPNAPGSSVPQAPVILTHAPSSMGVQVLVHDRGRQPLPGEIDSEGMGG